MDGKMEKTMEFTMGERIALMLLLTSFKGDRTSSTMRKTKRIKHAIQSLEIPDNAPLTLLISDTATITATMDNETLGWLWDTFTKFSEWPTQLDEWIDTLEDKLRAALAAA